MQEEQQKDLEKRVQEVLDFAKEKEILIGAVQKVTQEGYIETTPLYRNLKKYPKDIETTSEVTGTPEVDINENKNGTEV